MYVPWDRSSRAKDGSTSDVHLVSRFALSLGTGLPQLEHWIISLRPLPPLLRPRDFRFLVNYFHYRDCYSFVGLAHALNVVNCKLNLVGFREVRYFCTWFAA